MDGRISAAAADEKHYFRKKFGARRLTEVFGINEQSWMVGTGFPHGFAYMPPHQFVFFDYPGAEWTILSGINASGEIAGNYADSAYHSHGIILQLTQGQ